MSKILDIETAKINFDNVVYVEENQFNVKDDIASATVFATSGESATIYLPKGKRLKDFKVREIN
jgi:ethanolamine utilization protein EutQ (cupin superfamily)